MVEIDTSETSGEAIDDREAEQMRCAVREIRREHEIALLADQLPSTARYFLLPVVIMLIGLISWLAGWEAGSFEFWIVLLSKVFLAVFVAFIVLTKTAYGWVNWKYRQYERAPDMDAEHALMQRHDRIESIFAFAFFVFIVLLLAYCIWEDIQRLL